MPHLVTYQTLTDLSPIRGRDCNEFRFIYYVQYAPLPCRGGARVFAWWGGGGGNIWSLTLIFTDTWQYFSYVIPSHQFYQVNGRKCNFQTKFVDIWPWTWNLLLRGNILPFIYNIPTKCYHHRIFLAQVIGRNNNPDKVHWSLTLNFDLWLKSVSVW